MVGGVDGEEEEGGEAMMMTMIIVMRKTLVFNAYRKYISILYLDEVELIYTHNQRRGSKHGIR